MISKSKFTNQMIQSFKGGAMYTSGTRVGQVKEHDILWEGGGGATKGFGVRISMKTGSKTFFIQCRVRGTSTERTIKIGRFEDPWKVDQARDRARTLKGKMEDGTDPTAERKEQREAAARLKVLDAARNMTLRQLLEHFIDKHRLKGGRRLRAATERDYRRHVEKNLTEWLDLSVTTISRDMCDDKFREITDRGAPIQANLCMDYLRALINHFMKHRRGALSVNPVTEMLEVRNPEEPRDSRIPTEKIGAVWAMLSERAKDEQHRTACDWARFLILTGTRARESSQLLWSEVSLDTRMVTFPSEKTKNGKELVLPMSDLLHDLLEARKPKDATGYVFATRAKSGHISSDSSTSTWAAISEVAGTPINRHDLRRTFVDICDECDINGDQQRMLINHKTGGDVHSKHYRNSKRRLPEAVALTAAWVQREAEVAAGANVVPLRGATGSKAAG